MKTLVALVCSLMLMASLQSQTPGSSPVNASKEKTAEKQKAPAPPAPKMEGTIIARGERGFIGVQMLGATFRINFYDAKKKPVAPDVARAVLRWDPKYKVGKERVVLNLTSDGKALASPRNIRPPHQFKLFITLLKEATEAEEPVGETHVIDFRA